METQIYRTKDLPIAALLYSSDKKLVGIRREDGIVFFLFGDPASCNQLAEHFWQKRATVDAKSFSDALRSLKALIFNGSPEVGRSA